MAPRVFLFAGFLFVCLGWPLGHACAQGISQDTIRLQEVPVRASRFAPFVSGTRTQTIDTLLLQRQPGLTLADMLQQRSPLYLKSYGNGMLATVAFRGTTASQTAVLWNGLNIDLPTLGLSDFALLPPAPATQVTLQHGPSGALHGTGAVGGAVLLDNPISFTPGQRMQVSQEVGSFGHLRTAASAGFSDGNISLTASFSTTSSANNFRFQNTTAFGRPWETQENAAFRQISFTQDLHYRLRPNQRLSVRGWYVKTNRQVQPAMGTAQTNARQDDENLRLMGEWQGYLSGGTTTARVGLMHDDLDYRTAGGSPSLSKVGTVHSQLEHERNLLPNLLLRVGAEGQFFKAKVGGYGERKQEKRYSTYAWLRYDPLPILELSLNMRQAWVQGFNPPLTPTLGANLQVLEAQHHVLTLKASASRSYRVPTLNDRFWRSGGNPNLLPESGWGYESGLHHILQREKLKVETELTVYALRVQDWIQWQPSVAGYPEPVNLSKVRGNGVEFSGKGQYLLSPGWLLLGGVAYAYTQSEQNLPNAQGELQARQLFYVPHHRTASWAEARYQTWFLTVDAAFTDFRFTDNDNNQRLPAYFLANASLGKNVELRKIQVNLLAQVINATNTVYQTMAYRAMPPRHFRLSIGLQWHRRPYL